MKIVLASANSGKISEIKDFFSFSNIVSYKEVIGDFEIEETGKTFAENALIKATAIKEKIDDPNVIVISDDSGISVPSLGDIPGVYSARFAGEGASDRDNLNKLITLIKEKDLNLTQAYYSCAISIITKNLTYTTHGWMYGRVVDEIRGSGGFGYDPMFIPDGYEKTLGELDYKIKKSFSHRTKALELAKIIIDLYK